VSGELLTIETGAGGVTQSNTLSAGVITAGTLAAGARGVDGTVRLIGPSRNAIDRLGDIAVSGGDFTLADNTTALMVTGTVAANNITLSSGAAGPAISVGGAVKAAAVTSLTASTGSIDIGTGLGRAPPR
jgi:hypothetical protein